MPNAAIMTPLPPPGPKPISQAPNGSLWNEASGSLLQDIKAHKVGDILTITVSEESKASKTATTQTSKDTSLAGQFDFAGASTGGKPPVGAATLGPWTGKFSNGFNGSGVTAKADSMAALMTATVVGVVPNGNLIIRGSRWTQVNNEMQQIVLEGVIRPADITRNNTILSQSIAEAKIFIVGKGPLSKHQKPGWGLQLLDMVSPF
jgi:flagellar L-ring protein precursor FlgH